MDSTGPTGSTDATAAATQQLARLLEQAQAGDAHAAEELFPLVYDQMRALARHHMAGERAGHTLQATALVHEAYLRLLGSNQVPWRSQAQFFFAAAEAMRRILIDHARARGQLKRGGGGRHRRVCLDSVMDLAAEEQFPEILALDDAVSRLEKLSPRVSEVVRLRFYAGLSIDQTAEALAVSPRTVKRDWTYARAWLYRELSDDVK